MTKNFSSILPASTKNINLSLTNSGFNDYNGLISKGSATNAQRIPIRLGTTNSVTRKQKEEKQWNQFANFYREKSGLDDFNQVIRSNRAKRVADSAY